jgi:hypothetical protein
MHSPQLKQLIRRTLTTRRLSLQQALAALARRRTAQNAVEAIARVHG